MDKTQNESGWILSIKVTLGSLDHRDEKSFINSIPSVSTKLREHNEEAYSPKHVTIGPIHRGTSSQLLAIEEHKWHYMLALLHRTENPDPTLDKCARVILGQDDAVRASYGGNIKYDSHELAKIMLLDGCFLLELLLRFSPDMVPKIPKQDNHHGSSDPILGQQEMLSSILPDLTLLENQIPFFVLKTLARILFPHVFTSQADHLVAYLAQSLFGYPFIDCPDVAHFLHLMHLSTTIDKGQEVIQVKEAQQELKRCATRLRSAGVTLGPVRRPSRFVNGFGFDIRFANGVLEIPPLETIEVYLRNFIAWEQSRIGISRRFTSYALFLRGLVCSLQDIELLVSSGVLERDTKISNEDLLTFFGTITKEADQMDSTYSKLCEDLNTYSAVNPLKKFPIILWHYLTWIPELIHSLHGFLRTGYNFPAAIISFITVVQGVYAILSYHYPNKG